MGKILLVFLGLFLLYSCNSVDQNNKNQIKTDTSALVIDSTSMHREDLYKDVVFDSKKDVVCGMPTSAGVSDTAHYKQKAYGFCSAECKAAFVSNPTAYIAAK